MGRVAVDRLAKELGATRGSFYWHFRDRDDLIEAALELWEREWRTLTELGVDETEAESRAWVAYAFCLGRHQLRRNPDLATRRPTDLQHLVDLLIGR